MSIQYRISDKNSKFLQPSGGGGTVVDVVRDMAWTMSPKSSRADVPYVKLTEYQQTTGQLLAAIIYYTRTLTQISTDGANTLTGRDNTFDVYKFKYFAEPTGFSYKFPYFNTKKITRNNNFGQEENPFGSLIQLGSNIKAASFVSGRRSGILGLLGEVAPVAQSIGGVINTALPGRIGFEFPKSWDSTELDTVEITFDLFNTNNIKDIQDNRNLCHILSYQNSPSRRNFSIVDPPVIYSLDIPDVVSMPACYMSSLDIKNLGNTRLVEFNGVVRTVPEAYRLTMTFTSLLMPSRNILEAMDSGKTVEAISDIAPFQGFITALFNAAAEGFENENLNEIARIQSINVDRELEIPLGATGRNVIDPLLSSNE